MNNTITKGIWEDSSYVAEWIISEYAPEGCWEVITDPHWGSDEDWEYRLFKHLNPQRFLLEQENKDD